MTATTRIPVGAGDDAYDVVIGHDLGAAVPEALPAGVRRVMLIHPRSLSEQVHLHMDALRHSGFEVHAESVPDGEPAKTIEVATRLWHVLGWAGFTRTDAVVAVGGGAVTDIGGFVAATWLRGVPVVQVPTTLLGMVDAAVGGKTGINTAEGKNLVGSFHTPRAVICDLDSLATLPRGDLVAGLGEVVKCGFVADPAILDLIEADPAAVADPSSDALRELVERSIQVKADVVSADLRESLLREILNYGHTFGHAIEQVEDFTWRHGEAVSVGMVFVAELARRAGRLDGAIADRHRAVLEQVGLPVSYRGDRWDELLAAMRRDKKSRGDQLRFVVLDGLAQPGRLEGPDLELLRDTYISVSRASG